SADNNTARNPRRVDSAYRFRMSDMAWSSISTHRLQLHNFGRGMTATPVYANVMRSSPSQLRTLTSNYSITSSARESSVGWMEIPRTFSACYSSPQPAYRIKFAHTANYKTKPHAIATNTSQIAILPNLGTCP